VELGPHPGLGLLGEPPGGGHPRRTESRRELVPGAARGGHQNNRGQHFAGPRRRCPSPCGRTGAGGTTRWNNVHSSSGVIRSTSAAVITPDCRKITPTEMASYEISWHDRRVCPTIKLACEVLRTPYTPVERPLCCPGVRSAQDYKRARLGVAHGISTLAIPIDAGRTDTEGQSQPPCDTNEAGNHHTRLLRHPALRRAWGFSVRATQAVAELTNALRMGHGSVTRSERYRDH
jgi:hypothetical protein